MNTDLLTEDLKKARSSNQSFWLMGQPDVEVRKLKSGEWQVEVHGFDYFDTAKGELVSGGKGKIAMWLLDTDYDGKTFHISQAFFPGDPDAWEKLQRALKAQIDPEAFEKMRGITSFPFQPGEHRRIAVKVIDFRGNEVVRVISLGKVANQKTRR